MTFAIHASKNGRSVVTVRINPAVAVGKARELESLGWQVHVTDSAGHQFDPSDFDRLSSLADETAWPPRRGGAESERKMSDRLSLSIFTIEVDRQPTRRLQP